ncbi:common central domain of tyrosinase-domain-containing protein [Coniella lustricola]|uniref:Common central domain of tyrosinase-domain-containing protein n=1 Tax=Coniella lustricola TaxID=2025994 RepID=A0A2T3AGW8_9PEZI|nr:common central domain of tyrosinase-domain-containing protein [Coniella lustricola]
MVTAALCTSYDYGFDIIKSMNSKRQADGTIVTTGMPLRSDGSVPIRLEIRDLQQDTNQWSLYILALDMMQFTDQSDPTSWFSITSIHGVPFQPWGGVLPTPGNENSGYCHHQDILFPTWHRAYVSLYEVRTRNIRGEFETAAANCRAPYFDWAAIPADGLNILPPSVGRSPQVNVSGPMGVQSIANPLYNYEFKPANSSVFFDIAPWSGWNSTRRAPIDTDPQAPSNDSAVNQNLLSHRVEMQQRLYNLFSNYNNYTVFSNEGWAADTSQYDSLESIHDNVHAMLGGPDGHMTIVPFSAFDPLFFLHHCMVDRVLALWQVMHPTSWIASEAARFSSYTTSVGQVLDGSSTLEPFYSSSNGTFWNSDMLRDPAQLGYTYPEMAGIDLSNLTSVIEGQAGVAVAINRLYGGSSTNSISFATKRSLSQHPRNATSTNSPLNDLSPRLESASKVDNIISERGLYREWIANIRVERQALDGPFSVQLSFGNDLSPVGTMSVFASPPEVASLMQMAPGTHYISSTIPLTNALVLELEGGNIQSLEPAGTSTFLSQNLSVSVTRADGMLINPETVPGLSIKVISAVVQATSSEERLPLWEEPDYEMDVL